MNIHIIEDYDCFESPDGTQSFGVYDTNNKEIWVAGDINRINVVEILLHELAHYYQDIDNVRFNEKDADNIVKDWLEDLNEIFKNRVKGEK